LGYSPFDGFAGRWAIGLLSQMMRKNHINGIRAPFWRLVLWQRKKTNKHFATHWAN